MKLLPSIVAVAVIALLVANQSATAGWKPPITGVTIDDIARTASGSISSTRNTPDNAQQLVCWLDGTTSGITGNCHARNLAGLIRVCSTTNANLIQVIGSANGDSHVTFTWNVSNVCTAISVLQNSASPPKAP
ncbi:MAG: hypothetical protein ACKV2T_43190 [Kofleriaceae bacterium]